MLEKRFFTDSGNMGEMIAKGKSASTKTKDAKTLTYQPAYYGATPQLFKGEPF
jgi:hypothetical protein